LQLSQSAISRSGCVFGFLRYAYQVRRWPKFDPDGANVNVLSPGLKTDFGERTSVHGVEADLRILAAAE
jgi:hypothetical protein